MQEAPGTSSSEYGNWVYLIVFKHYVINTQLDHKSYLQLFYRAQVPTFLNLAQY